MGKYIRIGERNTKEHVCGTPEIKWSKLAGANTEPPLGTIWQCNCGRQYKAYINYDMWAEPAWKRLWFPRRS